MNTDVLIVGGGLAGLSLARQLQGANVDFHLVEARPRLGGRIVTQSVKSQGEIGYFDLGPTWFWPGQPRMEKLVRDLKLTAFLQYAEGELSFEQQNPDGLRQAACQQLGRIFCSEALNPLEVMLQDWACEPETATQLDYPLQLTGCPIGFRTSGKGG